MNVSDAMISFNGLQMPTAKKCHKQEFRNLDQNNLRLDYRDISISKIYESHSNCNESIFFNNINQK